MLISLLVAHCYDHFPIYATWEMYNVHLTRKLTKCNYQYNHKVDLQEIHDSQNAGSKTFQDEIVRIM